MNYLTNFEKTIRDDRQMKALTWVSKEEFKFLLEMFKETCNIVKEEEYKGRIKQNKESRKFWWRKGKLDTPDKILFFLLSYLKTYPTFDVLWSWFWLWRSSSCYKVHKYIPILKRLFEELWVSPKREIKKPEDFNEAFWKDFKELIVDATERMHFRHKDNEKQKNHYSGKKSDIPRKTQ